MVKNSGFIMALDQGTTSSRCIIFDSNADIVAMTQEETEQIYPKDGWVEHNPEEIFTSQISTARSAMEKAGIDAGDIVAIGITNQRESTIIWDRKTGKPVYNAIVWQCRRTSEMCENLKGKGFEETIRKKTGLPLDAYFSASKIRWILDNVPGAKIKSEAGELAFGTVDAWLIWKLTGGRVHATDSTNASRTMLFNIHSMDWDDELLDIFKVSRKLLPKVLPSAGNYGMTHSDIFGKEIPIRGVAGDQQAALFGEGCFDIGDVKNTYGTGCFMLMNTGEKPVSSASGLITTVAWQTGDRTVYALEGSVFVAGAAIQWLRDELGILTYSKESEDLAIEAGSSGGVYVVPAFVGLGAPYWKPHVRGAVFGLSRGSGRRQLVRAALEAIAYQTVDILEAMKKDSGTRLSRILADGGAAANGFLMQFQSDIGDVTVERLESVESTATGAAYFAGLSSGFWKDLRAVAARKSVAARYVPSMQPEERERLLRGWHAAVDCASQFPLNF